MTKEILEAIINKFVIENVSAKAAEKLDQMTPEDHKRLFKISFWKSDKETKDYLTTPDTEPEKRAVRGERVENLKAVVNHLLTKYPHVP